MRIPDKRIREGRVGMFGVLTSVVCSVRGCHSNSLPSPIEFNSISASLPDKETMQSRGHLQPKGRLLQISKP